MINSFYARSATDKKGRGLTKQQLLQQPGLDNGSAVGDEHSGVGEARLFWRADPTGGEEGTLEEGEHVLSQSARATDAAPIENICIVERA